jgi:flagellar motility protein MotE (MotC chaperone)
MTRASSGNATDERYEREARGGAFSLYLIAFGLLVGLATPSVAQQGWAPTVATVPGGSFPAPPPGVGKRMSTNIDPKYFPPPNSPPVRIRDPLPQGAWSPIVTGGIPEPVAVPPTTIVNAPRGTQDRIVPALEALTPIRPLTPKAMAAAGGAQNSGGASEPNPAQTTPSAVELGAEAEGSALFKKPGPLETPPPNATAAQQYCFNTVDTAADARFAWQAKKIKEMEGELDKRAQQLEAKTEEYKQWLQRRDDFSRKAHEKLVGFYSRMRPDAAALQLATLDEEMAAAVVTKLETKVASQIMGEMDPERAAKIATIISGAAKIPPDRRRAPAPSGSAPPGPPNVTPLPLPEQPRS